MPCWPAASSAGGPAMRGDPIDTVMAVAGAIVRPLVYLTLALPAAIVVTTSFTQGESLRFPPQGFSLRWYWEALQSEPFMSALWTSTRLATVATVIALAIGLAAAFALDRYRF